MGIESIISRVCHCCDQPYEDYLEGLYCNNCDTFYLPEYDESIYNKDYCDLYVERGESDLNDPLQKIRWDIVEKYEVDGNVVLDIGCGAGAFLKAAPITPKEWSVFGHDINKDCVAHCLENGIVCLDKLPIRLLKSISVITMFDVLEHFKNLNKTLTAVKGMLVEGGLFVVSLPNYKKEYKETLTEWRHYRPGEHIFYLSIDSMKALAEKSGFELLEHNFLESKIRNPPEDNIATYVMRLK